ANVIERAAIVATGPMVGEDDLPPLARRAASPHAQASPVDSRDAGPLSWPEVAQDGDATLETVERTHIVRVLERAGWVIEGKTGAAAILGLAPSTLRSRMTLLAIRRTAR
ncbi:MAG TPA: helix-turn-helix domain-containing protein, partial [Polyangiaceae bacterium]|nr:helix-turn-helix domain-containing protein [Polyangiaceae bacterium]